MCGKTFTKTILLAAVLSLALPIPAQRNLTLHSMQGLAQATAANPAFIPDANVVIGLPGLNAGIGNNGFRLQDAGAEGWDMEGLKLKYREVLPLVRENNLAYAGLSANLFALGIQSKGHYFALEASEHINGSFLYPRDAIAFGARLEGAAGSAGDVYQLEKLAYSLSHYRSLSLIYARRVGRVSAGARIHYLIGLENFSSGGNGISLTDAGEGNSFGLQGLLELRGAGVQSLAEGASYDLWGAGNYGFAFDLGSAYQLSDRFQAALSVINLGGIRWDSDVNQEVLFGRLDEPGEAIEDIFDGLVEEEPAAGVYYSTALPTQVYLSGRYQFSPSGAAQLLLNPRFGQGGNSLAASLAYNQRVGRWLQFSGSWSAIDGHFFNFGLGLAAKAGPLQLYMITDNLVSAFDPASQYNAHVQAGLNLAFRANPPLAERTEEVMPEVDDTRIPVVVASPPQPVIGAPAAPRPAKGPEKYAVVNGAVQIEGDDSPVTAFHLDVYKLLPDGRRELARTGHQAGNTFRLYLERAYTYFIRIESWGCERMEMEVTATQLQEAEAPLQLTAQLKKAAPATPVAAPAVVAAVTPPASAPAAERPAAVAPTPPKEEGAPTPVAEPSPAVQAETQVEKEEPQPVETTIAAESAMQVAEKEAPGLQQHTFRLAQDASLLYEMGDTSRVMARLSAGVQVEVLERTTPEWWLVGYRNKVGWIAVAVLK